MIIFKKIKWRNFLSTGNHFSEIDLIENRTNLIVGVNGSGKSTVLDALTFSLFGKPFRRINKPQLVNSVNEKECKVEVEFSIGNTNWKIVRGIKPSIFEIWRNDTFLDQSSASIDQQKWLEQNILKMNYKSFTQIVILGSSAFIPFMQLSAAHRREVIEDLLDIKIFSSMNLVIKEKIRQTKEEIQILELKKQSFLDKIEMQKKFIEDIEARGKDTINQKKNKIIEIEKLEFIANEKNEDHQKKLKELNEDVKKFVGISDSLKKLGKIKGKISQKVSTIIEEHRFFTENTVCPTCTQTIDENFRINKIEDSKNKAKELQLNYIELENTIKSEEEREKQFSILSEKISQITNDIFQNNIKISSYKKQIKELESEIQTIIKQSQDRNIEHEKLKEFEANFKLLYDDIISKKELIKYYDFSYNLLKDGGVKTKIIKKYLPVINQQVNRYLQMMDFYINFTLDEEFNETIQSSIHEDFSYSSFSEGEKARINLALLFAWREVAKYKNSVHTNLILFDEVFDSSLDGFGTEEFLKIIRYVIKDTNVFVISHKSGLEDKFEKVLRAEKIKGFSKISKI